MYDENLESFSEQRRFSKKESQKSWKTLTSEIVCGRRFESGSGQTKDFKKWQSQLSYLMFSIKK